MNSDGDSIKNQFHRQIRNLPDLEQCVFDCVRQIPAGKATTYGDIADFLGNKAASRWVGKLLLNHSHTDSCNCHRVVRAGGELGLFVGNNKAKLLFDEGVVMQNGRVDMKGCGFSSFQGERPLRQLSRLQEKLVQENNIRSWKEQRIERIAGVDVSYRGKTGFAAYVIYDLESTKIEWTSVVSYEVTFPYIPSFLSFRELPLLLELIERAAKHHESADLIMVDGSGILHPRRAGIATMLGLLVDIPTIGVTKKRLVGNLEHHRLTFGKSQHVSLDGQVLGSAFLPRPSTKKPLYVSPGNRIDVNTASRFVRKCMLGRSLPEPIYWADKISRAESKKNRLETPDR